MTPDTGSEARPLIVVSKDYGEFGLAAAFVRGQEFARRAAMLLPDSLYEGNQNTLPITTLRYATRQDILRVVDQREPDLVFLFSGYLLPNDQLISRKAVDSLVGELRDRGCRVATSDPFLGLASNAAFSRIDARMLIAGRSLLNRWFLRLSLWLQGSKREILRLPNMANAAHVYPSLIPFADRDDGVARCSFFNPATIRVGSNPPDITGKSGHAAVSASRPHWLFVLSSTDLESQSFRSGAAGVVQLVAGLLRHAAAAERHPILIAPASLIDELSSELPDEVELLPFCPLAEFDALLLSAEYVFYWNAFSFSVLPRIANERPVFFFDRGHLSLLASWARDDSTIKDFYEVAKLCHFGGWTPTFLDQTEPLDPVQLANLAEAQRPAMRTIRERWQVSPTPDELVDRLLEEHTDT